MPRLKKSEAGKVLFFRPVTTLLPNKNLHIATSGNMIGRYTTGLNQYSLLYFTIFDSFRNLVLGKFY